MARTLAGTAAAGRCLYRATSGGFSKTVQEHTRKLALEGANGTVLRDQLRERLDRLFRAAAGTVVATLCHLALMALDFERLRGGLVNRALFPRGG
jgi:hypothetical protein